MLHHEVAEARIARILDAMETVDGIGDLVEQDRDFWQEARTVGKRVYDSGSNTWKAWLAVGRRFGERRMQRLQADHGGYHHANNCRYLAGRAMSWSMMARQLNRAVYRRVTRKGQGRKVVVRIRLCDSTAAKHQGGDVAALTDEELRGINSRLDEFGLVVPAREREIPIPRDRYRLGDENEDLAVEPLETPVAWTDE
ncbi:hypothetical protein BDV24DRAFT_170207 [Aspergillus arachidicola]|uniref:Uncharacterized protein n=1 Tax=Aspergillus arachidicola TaxID=656916 RepID=A0A5N6XML7_9EURO|nr:hypothetical protein BDV24DRAFT_170207 [Aspergillus arachidicola]